MSLREDRRREIGASIPTEQDAAADVVHWSWWAARSDLRQVAMARWGFVGFAIAFSVRVFVQAGTADLAWPFTAAFLALLWIPALWVATAIRAPHAITVRTAWGVPQVVFGIGSSEVVFCALDLRVLMPDASSGLLGSRPRFVSMGRYGYFKKSYVARLSTMDRERLRERLMHFGVVVEEPRYSAGP